MEIRGVGSGNVWAPSQPVPTPLPQVAGWEAQKKEQPMFGEEQHVRYGHPRLPLNPPGHPTALLGTPGSPGHLMCHLGPPKSTDTPRPPWAPQDSCVCAPHPTSPGSPESHGHPLSPVGIPGTPMSFQGPTYTPCPWWAARGPHVSPPIPHSRVPPAPHIPAGFPGVPVPHVPVGAPWLGAVLSGGSALGWAIRGAPRALPPALPHSPAGSGRRRRELAGGGRGEPGPAPAPPLHPPRALRQGTPGDPHFQHLQSGLEGSPRLRWWDHGWVQRFWGAGDTPRIMGALYKGHPDIQPPPHLSHLSGIRTSCPPPKHEGGLLGRGARGVQGAGDHPVRHG